MRKINELIHPSRGAGVLPGLGGGAGGGGGGKGQGGTRVSGGMIWVWWEEGICLSGHSHSFETTCF